jgi:hypothetical protein
LAVLFKAEFHALGECATIARFRGVVWQLQILYWPRELFK